MGSLVPFLSRFAYGLLCLTTVTVLYCFAIALYRLTLHPLAKTPGPILASVTDWYNVYTAWSGDRHLDFFRLHQKYGPVVRYGPSRVSINTNTALQTIYSRKANVQKSKYYDILDHYHKGPTTVSSIGRRKILAQGLTPNSIALMEDHILKNVRIFCGKLMMPDPFQGKVAPDPISNSGSSRWSPPKDMSRWINYLTFDTMGDLCYSRNFGMLNSTENHFMLDMVAIGSQGLNTMGHMQGLAHLHLDRLLFRDLADANERYQAFGRQQVASRITKGDKIETKDYFYFLETGTDPKTGEQFTLDELVSEAALLIGAGTDTSAAAITSTLFYLLHNPRTLERLTLEILGAFSDVEEIRGSAALSSCVYLRACVDEAMRMSPGIAGILPREVLVDGMTVDGIFYPPGIDVGVPHYTIHHNETYYPQSFEYIPERWIIAEKAVYILPDTKKDWKDLQSPASVGLARSAYCPFSLGPRVCPGKSMAYREISIVLGRMIYLFEMKLAPGRYHGGGNPRLGEWSGRHRPGEYQGKDMIVFKAEGPVVEFKLRKR